MKVSRVLPVVAESTLNVASVILIALILYLASARIFSSPADASAKEYERRSTVVLGHSVVGTIGDYDFSKHQKTVVLSLRSDCHYCQESIGFHRSLIRSASASNGRIGIIAVFDEPLGQALAALKLEHLDVPVVRVAQLASVGVQGTPTVLIVNNQGVIERAFPGKLSQLGEDEVFAKAGTQRTSGQTEGSTSGEQEVASLAQGLSGSIINAAQASSAIRENNPTILDIRSRDDFAAGHIAGALNIPRDELEARAEHELDPSKDLLVYCTYKNKCEQEFRNRGVLTGCTISLFTLKGAGLEKSSLIGDDLVALQKSGVKLTAATPATAKVAHK
jgi:hypothetical protein